MVLSASGMGLGDPFGDSMGALAPIGTHVPLHVPRTPPPTLRDPVFSPGMPNLRGAAPRGSGRGEGGKTWASALPPRSPLRSFLSIA